MIKISGVRLTDRDIDILRFVNEFGFCEMSQIEKRFGMKSSYSYRVIRRLVKIGFMNHQRLFHMRNGIYFLTTKGAECTDLPPIKKISLGQFEHQRAVTDVYIKLREKIPEALWISERQLKHDKFYEGVGKTGHLSDGMLVFPDGKQIAIEVELSLKGKNRIERIFKGYGAQFSIKEAWYYCPEGLIKPLKKLAEKMPFIKIYNIAEFLA